MEPWYQRSSRLDVKGETLINSVQSIIFFLQVSILVAQGRYLGKMP